MTQIKRAQVNKIMHSAFLAFRESFSESEFKAMFAGGLQTVSVWRVSEGDKRVMFVAQYETQINRMYLAELGFSEDAEVEELFSVDRQTKTVDGFTRRYEVKF